MFGNAFWSHTIWFILLGITTLIELAILLWKTERRMFIIALFLTISGLTFSFEMIIHSYFKAYTYFPKLIPHMPSDDSIAGNLFSQFSVSATAILIALFRLRYYWYFVISAVYGIIEELFLKLGVYEHNWYQTWMTVALLPVLFWITQKAYDICFKPMWRYWRYVFVFFGLVTLHVHTIGWTLHLAGIRNFSEHLVADKDRSIVILNGIYMLVLGSVMISLYFSRIKWRLKLPIILVLYIAVKISEQCGLIIFKEGWFLPASSIFIWGMYFYTYLFDQKYNQYNIVRDDER